MTHKIAIIKTKEYMGYEDFDYTVVQSISEWSEVTDEEFDTLQYAGRRLGFILLEQPTDMPKFIAKTIADYLAISKAEETRAEKEKKAREKVALDKKIKKELKTVESKRALLKKLQEELGDDVSSI